MNTTGINNVKNELNKKMLSNIGWTIKFVLTCVGIIVLGVFYLKM
jgi:hypothetical protein